MRKRRNLEASAAKKQFDKLLEEVSRDKARILLKRNGSAVAAIVSAQDLERLQRLETNAEQALTLLRSAFSDLSEEQIVEDVDRVVQEVRAERRRNNQAQAGR